MKYAEITDYTFTEVYKQYELNIYPNPARNRITIESNFVVEQVTIQSMEGRLIRQIDAVNGVSLSVNVSDYPAGMYIITVTGKDGSRISKLQSVGGWTLMQ